MEQTIHKQIENELQNKMEFNDNLNAVPVHNTIGTLLVTQNDGLFVNQANSLKVSPKILLTRNKQKYRLIRKSPLKGSPVKNVTHILQRPKHKKKGKCLSPRKLQFILPKVPVS